MPLKELLTPRDELFAPIEELRLFLPVVYYLFYYA